MSATPLPIVICDDSTLARKQMVRALSGWNVTITEAVHGLEALEAIRAGKGDLLFLDLNMPIMDGYQVLERIRSQDLPTLVIVVSGDIQREAHRRVMALGALGFINKPIDAGTLKHALNAYGLSAELEARPSAAQIIDAGGDPSATALQLHEYYQELANVAMGRAADLLARVLGAFIQLPIPRVRLIEAEETAVLLDQLKIEAASTSTLCQGICAPSIAGEALLIFDQHSIADAARLMRHEGAITTATQRELLMDFSNILISAFLSGLGEQLDIDFSQGVPVILGQHYHLPPADNLETSGRTLAIEIEYRIEGYDISCNLLLLFTEDSLPALNERTRYL